MIRLSVRTTIVFGLGAGLFFIPARAVISVFLYEPLAFRLTLWLCLAFYALLMTRWSRKGTAALIFPMLLLLIPAVWGSPVLFLLLSLAVLSWLRSGLFFPGRLAAKIPAELCLTLGGAALVDYFSPHTPLSWALGIWLFFLVQGLYFLIFAEEGRLGKEDQTSAFERARRESEEILSGQQ